MSQLEMVLDLLSDGEWHSLGEIEDAILLKNHQVQEIVSFLFEYDLVSFDSENGVVKIKRPFREFLVKTLC